MSVYSIFCPQCHTALRTSSPLPPGQVIRCPQCGDNFTSVEPQGNVPLAKSAASPVLKTGLIAFGMVGVLGLLVAGGVGLALLPKAEQPHDQVAEAKRRQAEAEQRAAEENRAIRKQLEEQRQEAERNQRRLEQELRDMKTKAQAREERPASPPPVTPVASPPSPSPADVKAAADEAARKTRADYESHVDAGRAAMIDQRYADALREYRAALRLMPDDAVATRGERDAQDRLDAQQEKGKRRAEIAGLLDKARTAFKAKRFDDAIAAANDALQIAPDDAAAKQMKRDATRAKQTAQALQLSPDDTGAQQGKALADQATVNALNLQSGVNAYYGNMAAGLLSMQNLQYASAAQAFANALSIAPGDLAAARGLADAQLAATGAAVEQAKYYQHLNAGYTALQTRRPADAIKNFQAALRLAPNSQLAAVGLRQAQAMNR